MISFYDITRKGAQRGLPDRRMELSRRGVRANTSRDVHLDEFGVGVEAGTQLRAPETVG